MSTFYLLNTTRIGTQTRNAGDFIDDLIVDTGPLLAAGGLLWPSSDAIVAAAAVKCAKLRGQGQSGLVLDQMMSSAVNASQLATEGGAPGGIDGAHIIASTILDVAHAAGSKFGQLLAFLTGSGKLTNAGIDDASKLGLLRDTLTLAGQSTDASVDPASGLGTYLRTTRRVTPTGVAATDVARIVAALADMAGVGELRLLPGTFAIDTPIVVPDYSRIIGHPNAAIVSTITPTGGGGHARAVFTRDDISTPSHSTSLTANAVPGAVTISVTASTGIVVGGTIFVSNNSNQCATFTVRSVTGSGPYTVELDRPLLYAFPSAGSSVGVFTQPRDIRIADLTFTGGTGDRAISLVSAWNCKCESLRLLSPRFGDYQMSFDTGSRFSKWEDVYVDDTIYPAIAMEGCEGCSMERVTINKCGSADTAIIIQAAYDWTVRDCHVREAAASGIHVGYTTDAIASRGGRIEGSSFISCSVGIAVDGGSRDVEITNCEISYNTNFGMQIAPSAGGTPDRVRGRGNRFIGNAMHAYVDSAQAVRLTDSYMENSTNGAVQIQAGSQIWLTGLDAQENIAQFTFVNYGEMHVRDARLSSTKSTGTASGAIFFRTLTTATLLTLREVEINAPAGKGAGISAGSGTTICEGVRSTGLLLGSYAGGLGTATLIRWRGAVDFSSASTPITNDTLGTHQFDVAQAGGKN